MNFQSILLFLKYLKFGRVIYLFQDPLAQKITVVSFHATNATLRMDQPLWYVEYLV